MTSNTDSGDRWLERQRNLQLDAQKRGDDKALRRETGISLERLKLLQQRDRKRVLAGGEPDDALR